MLKLVLVLIAALLFQFPAAAHADEAAEIAAVRAATDTLGQAFVSEDVAAIKALMTLDHVAIGPTYDGPVSVDEQLALFPRITLTEWVPTEPEISLLSDTVAMTMFGLSIRGTMDGAPLPTRAYATEIWLKRDGKWLQHVYQETAIVER